MTPLKSQSLTTRSRIPQSVSRSGGSSPCLTTSPMEEMIRCIDRSSKLDRDVAYKNDGTADKTTRNLTITTSIITEGRGIQSYVVSPCDHENLFNTKNGFECLAFILMENREVPWVWRLINRYLVKQSKAQGGSSAIRQSILLRRCFYPERIE